jgi:hypothetical protein
MEGRPGDPRLLLSRRGIWVRRLGPLISLAARASYVSPVTLLRCRPHRYVNVTCLKNHTALMFSDTARTCLVRVVAAEELDNRHVVA